LIFPSGGDTNKNFVANGNASRCWSAKVGEETCVLARIARDREMCGRLSFSSWTSRNSSLHETRTRASDTTAGSPRGDAKEEKLNLFR